MEVNDIRESGSDSDVSADWAIVDEGPALENAIGDTNYVFRGDIPGVAGNQSAGEVSDGESIEIVPEFCDIESIEAVPEAREMELPPDLDETEKAETNDEDTFVNGLAHDAAAAAAAAAGASNRVSASSAEPRLNERDHWDLAAILLVVLVGGFAVGLFCGAAGSTPSGPSEELVAGLRAEVRSLRSALAAASLAGPGSAPRPLGSLYADFASFQCRWREDRCQGKAFCVAGRGVVGTQPSDWSVLPAAGEPSAGVNSSQPNVAVDADGKASRGSPAGGDGCKVVDVSSDAEGGVETVIATATAEGSSPGALPEREAHAGREPELRPRQALARLKVLAPGVDITALAAALALKPGADPRWDEAASVVALRWERRVVKAALRLASRAERALASAEQRALRDLCRLPQGAWPGAEHRLLARCQEAELGHGGPANQRQGKSEKRDGRRNEMNGKISEKGLKSRESWKNKMHEKHHKEAVRTLLGNQRDEKKQSNKPKKPEKQAKKPVKKGDKNFKEGDGKKTHRKESKEKREDFKVEHLEQPLKREWKKEGMMSKGETDGAEGKAWKAGKGVKEREGKRGETNKSPGAEDSERRAKPDERKAAKSAEPVRAPSEPCPLSAEQPPRSKGDRGARHQTCANGSANGSANGRTDGVSWVIELGRGREQARSTRTRAEWVFARADARQGLRSDGSRRKSFAETVRVAGDNVKRVLREMHDRFKQRANRWR